MSAGIAAAISAAEAGASVKLLEAHGCLGSIGTSGMLALVIEPEKPGINTKLIQRLEALEARRAIHSSCVDDVEIMKIVLEEYCREQGATTSRFQAPWKVSRNAQTRGNKSTSAGIETIADRGIRLPCLLGNRGTYKTEFVETCTVQDAKVANLVRNRD